MFWPLAVGSQCAALLEEERSIVARSGQLHTICRGCYLILEVQSLFSVVQCPFAKAEALAILEVL